MSSTAVRAASWSGDLRRGTKATTTAPIAISTVRPFRTRCRSGIPRAWYCPQSQSENGECRSNWETNVRSQKSRSACEGLGSSSSTQKAASVVARNAPAKTSSGRGLRGPSGYVAQSGTTISDAIFVQPASAVPTPRPTGDEQSQKPQTRNAGMIASFVFALSAYAVNGYATQAKASVTASRQPPNLLPTRKSPNSRITSHAMLVKCPAGRSSQRPGQPKNQ